MWMASATAIPIRITGKALVMTKNATPPAAMIPRVMSTEAAMMTFASNAGARRRNASRMISVITSPASGFRRWASASM